MTEQGLDRVARGAARFQLQQLAQQHECSAGLPSLTKQRREVLSHPELLEQLGLDHRHPIEFIAGSNNRSKVDNIIDLSTGYEDFSGPHPEGEEEPRRLARASP